jgi:Putative undecaprenyl diphosphate synthase
MRRTSSSSADQAGPDRRADDVALRHVMVVGGTVADWGDLADAAWSERIRTLGQVAGQAGASWLTLRPFERGAGAEQARPIHHSVTREGDCDVIVDPTSDGRERLVVTLRKLAEDGRLSDSEVAAALLAPAGTEPDLVLLLGSHERLPSSLVWELAYSELVYVPITWAELRAEHLVDAIDAYRHRHRRFGGLD